MRIQDQPRPVARFRGDEQEGFQARIKRCTPVGLWPYLPFQEIAQ